MFSAILRFALVHAVWLAQRITGSRETFPLVLRYRPNPNKTLARDWVVSQYELKRGTRLAGRENEEKIVHAVKQIGSR
ncbi:hypothetical protein F4678DRAFT_347220 [Xylaria arbuscula]|nr:hypothetical protein F4678DRAFT_347220 [Xylaria arbuscula]